MSKSSDNPADPFKKALAEATKTMAQDADLNVTYSVDPSGISGDTMRLPQVSRRMHAPAHLWNCLLYTSPSPRD